MKRKEKIILAVFAVFGFLIFLNSSYKESFVSLNPLPTTSDLESVVNNQNITPTGQKIVDYISKINWKTPITNMSGAISGLGFIFSDKTAGLEQTTTLINSYSTRPTFQQAITDWNNLRTSKFDSSLLQKIMQGSSNSQPDFANQGDVAYQLYKYVFGDDTSTPTNSPITMYIPQPCNPSFKSIPGGAVDVHCFN